MDGTERNCGAENKISIMKIQLEDAESKKQKLTGQADVTKECMYDVDTEISNLKYKIKKHEEYLIQMRELKDIIYKFEFVGIEIYYVFLYLQMSGAVM